MKNPIHRGSSPWLAALALAAAACAPEAIPAPPPPPVAPPAEPPRAPAAVEGTVVGEAGEPIAGALVAVVGRFDPDGEGPVYDAISDARGAFRFPEIPPGRYGVTATSPGRTAAYAGTVDVRAGAGAAPVTLRLAGKFVDIAGTVRDERGAPIAGARVFAAAISENDGDIYVVKADSQGRYQIRALGGFEYFMLADDPPRERANRRADLAAPANDLTMGPPLPPRPADEVIAAWLRARAKPISGDREIDEAGAKAFAAVVGDAPLVGMGEATHGSSEFPEWRRRVFQALVRDHGFTVYAGEFGWAEALALDDYVVTGRGDPRAAIRGLVTWKDETEETLSLVTWMRSYNADPKHRNKLHIAGFDPLPYAAVPGVIAYLKKVDAAAVPAAEKALAPLSRGDAEQTYPALPAATREETGRAIGALVARMDANHARYAARSGEEAWARGRQLARVVQQAATTYADYGKRDALMVENVRWLQAHHPAGTKMLLDAHNGHIAAEDHGGLYMGKLLREAFGARYVTIGFAFSAGGVHTMDWRKDRSPARVNITLEPAAKGTFDGDLGLAGLPSYLIDLRGAEGPVGDWLRSRQRMHHVGGAFVGEEGSYARYTPGRAFDAVVYLDRVTPIHPLPKP